MPDPIFDATEAPRLIPALLNRRGHWASAFWVCVALVGAAVGIYFAFYFKGGSPYTFQETLPKMVSAFGADARVVQILVSSDNVSYEVIGHDGLLHRRVYELQFSRDAGGGTSKTRKVENSVRKPTPRELREAHVRLGQLTPGVVDSLYHRVDFPNDGSSAVLTGETWLLESGARVFDHYKARYDGTALHQTQSKATVFGSKPPSQTTAQSPARPNVVTKSSITIRSSGGAQSGATVRKQLRRLLACIQRAEGAASKILSCQQRYAP